VSAEKLEEMDGVHKIIDRIFDEFTRWYFLCTLFIYFSFFLTPFLLGMFGFLDPRLSLSVCSITMICFILIEFTELMNGGRAYFKNLLNWVDMLLIVSWYLYCTIIWEFGPKELLESKEYTDDIVRMNVLRVFIVSVSFIKIVTYCRVF